MLTKCERMDIFPKNMEELIKTNKEGVEPSFMILIKRNCERNLRHIVNFKPEMSKI